MAAADSNTSSNNNKMSMDNNKDCRKNIAKLGSVISCTDGLGRVHQGEVLAHDSGPNIVILSKFRLYFQFIKVCK